jgi:predicted DNA binding CopG/RHH family protein
MGRKSLAVTAVLQDMLHAMQQTAAPAPSAKSQSFAGMLAALAAPVQPYAPAWSDEDLADDYATLSYERALRSHSRYRNLKSASITIRLSEAESAQLRKRAAEAGLTISAYLRSCTFEAESLRALVKDTLAQLRSDPSKAEGSASNRTAANDASRPIRRSWLQRWARFWPRAQAVPGAARA